MEVKFSASRRATHADLSLTRAAKMLHHISILKSQVRGKVTRVAESCCFKCGLKFLQSVLAEIFNLLIPVGKVRFRLTFCLSFFLVLHHFLIIFFKHSLYENLSLL